MNAANFLSGALSPDVVALLYLASGILFILALRGLSSPDTSRSMAASASEGCNIQKMVRLRIQIATDQIRQRATRN